MGLAAYCSLCALAPSFKQNTMLKTIVSKTNKTQKVKFPLTIMPTFITTFLEYISAPLLPSCSFSFEKFLHHSLEYLKKSSEGRARILVAITTEHCTF